MTLVLKARLALAAASLSAAAALAGFGCTAAGSQQTPAPSPSPAQVVASTRTPETVQSGADATPPVSETPHHGGATTGGPPTEQPGHTTARLPASRSNVELVGRLTVSGIVPGRISDVGALGDFAYLGAFSEPCGNGGAYVIDISDPAQPREVGFISTASGSFVGEGLQALHLDTLAFKGDVLVISNEVCEVTGSQIGGLSLFDVTDPLRPVALAEGAGDTEPPGANSRAHQIHSAFVWQQGERAYAVLVDEEEDLDVDILEITDPRHPVLIAETGLPHWPEAHDGQSTGMGAFKGSFHHDVVVKETGGHWLMLLSYWDAGYVVLNVDDPADPVFVAHSSFTDPDPETGASPPEGNAHQAEWSRDNRFIIGTTEDFSPERLLGFRITSGPDAGEYPGDIFNFGRSVSRLPDARVNGRTVFGGYGCNNEVTSIPSPSIPGALGAGEETVLVLQRGPRDDPNHPYESCTFSEKAQNARVAGYDAVIIANHHEGAVGGAQPDDPFCGSGVTTDIVAFCTGHRALHLLFGRSPDYTIPYLSDDNDDTEPSPGDLGAEVSIETRFDGWGYVHLFDPGTLKELDTFAITQSLDPAFSDEFGLLSVHEVATDPRADLAYLSYYSAGLRVLKFGEEGLQEVGHYIDAGGNNFWGVQVHQVTSGQGHETLILASDTDSGLWIFRYAGPGQ